MLKWIGIQEDLYKLEEEKEYIQLFVRKIEGYGIDILRLPEPISGRKVSEGLVIIDARNTYQRELIGNMPVIGFDTRQCLENKLIARQLPMAEGIPYIIESFEGLDMDYVQMVYHRYHKRPLDIARTKRGILREITLEDIPTLWQMGISIRSFHGCADKAASLQDGILSEKQISLEEQVPLEESEFVKAYIKSMYEFYNYGMWILCKTQRALWTDNKYVHWEHKHVSEDRIQPEGSIMGIAGLDHIDLEALPENSIIKEKAERYFCLQAGYHIGYNYRRQGYGLETLQAVVAYGFQYIGVEAVILLIESQNIPSLKLAGKAGFTYWESITYRGKSVEVYGMENWVIGKGTKGNEENINY